VRREIRFRRFSGATPGCARGTFTEPVPAVVRRYARRTARLAPAVEAVACAGGGAGGARRLAEWGIALSADTALRAIAAALVPAHPTPRVLGVADWAKRTGQTDGAILVDLERHRVVDLLPDRRATTFATWRRDRPGVAVLSRDRGGAFAEGARHGAPAAAQVADRFHLVKDVVEVVARVAQRHHAALTTAATRLTETALAAHAAAVAAAAVSPGAPETAATAAARPEATRDGREQAQRRAAHGARDERVLALRQQGVGRRASARETGSSRATVRRFRRAGACPERRPRPPRATLPIPHEPYLPQQGQVGNQNATALHRARRARGFAGAVGPVRDLLATWRGGPARRGRRPRAARPPPQATPPPAPVPPLSGAGTAGSCCARRRRWRHSKRRTARRWRRSAPRRPAPAGSRRRGIA